MREPGSAQVNSHGGNGGIRGLSTEEETKLTKGERERDAGGRKSET